MSPGPEYTEFIFDLVVCPVPGWSNTMLCDVYSFNKYINLSIQGYLHSSLIVIVLYLAASSYWTALFATPQIRKYHFYFLLKIREKQTPRVFRLLDAGHCWSSQK